MSGGIERTAAVVIGTGLSGLAVASELQRRGVDSIIVDGLDLLGAGHPANTSSLQRCDAADAASLRERNEILRHLRNYATSHKLDVRNNIRALQLDHLDAGVTGPTQQWAVRTPGGVLLADHLVLTRCAHSQLRRMLSELGMAAGQNLMAAMHALGMYLVGVGELITPDAEGSAAPGQGGGPGDLRQGLPRWLPRRAARGLCPRRAGLGRATSRYRQRGVSYGPSEGAAWAG